MLNIIFLPISAEILYYYDFRFRVYWGINYKCFGGTRSVSSYILHVHFTFALDKSTLATAAERFWSNLL